MNIKEKRLAANLLQMASKKYSNHDCNDLAQETIDAARFTATESAEFVAEFRAWNGDPEWPERFDQMQDWQVMDFMAHKLTESD